MLGDLFQPLHLIVILVIALLVFGPGKLPQIGAGLGKSIREFKKAVSGADEEVRKVADNTQAGEKQGAGDKS